MTKSVCIVNYVRVFTNRACVSSVTAVFAIGSCNNRLVVVISKLAVRLATNFTNSLVFTSCCAAFAIGYLLAAPITVVIVGRKIHALGILNTANVAVVVVIFVCAIGHFVIADVALVVIVSIYALGDSKTANVTLVVAIQI